MRDAGKEVKKINEELKDLEGGPQKTGLAKIPKIAPMDLEEIPILPSLHMMGRHFLCPTMGAKLFLV